MKTAMLAVAALALVASAHGMAHAGKCESTCNKCEDTDANDMLATYDKLMKLFANETTNKEMKNDDYTKPHMPFICKEDNANRRELAAHAIGTYRVAVNYEGGNVLHPMTKGHHMDMVQVVDASASSHGRALAGHKGTLFYQKTWAADGEYSGAAQNPCMTFKLLKSDSVTHLQAFAHCNIHGSYSSKKIAVADIPTCQANMAAKAGRRLAAHAGKCVAVHDIDAATGKCNPDPANTDTASDSPASSMTVSFTVVMAALLTFFKVL